MVTDNHSRFLVDTHPLWWYLRAPDRLSPAVSAIFRLAETGNATIVVPAIVIAEFHFLSVKSGLRIAIADLLDTLEAAAGIRMSILGRRQMDLLADFPEISEIHDRLIAAESVAFNMPLITKDAELLASAQIETIW